MNSKRYEKELRVMRALSAEIGAILRAQYRKRHTEEWKSDGVVGIHMEKNLIGPLVRERLTTYFPEYSIWSEELPELRKTHGWAGCWFVVDEIDGTIPFMRRLARISAFCIAFCVDGIPVISIVNAALDDNDEGGEGVEYVAIHSEGVLKNGKPIQCSSESILSKAFMVSDGGKEDKEKIKPYKWELERNGTQGVVAVGDFFCASMGIRAVADGRIEVYAGSSLAPEDLAAVTLVAKEAGCMVTNFAGAPWRLGDDEVLVANPALHEIVLQRFRHVTNDLERRR